MVVFVPLLGLVPSHLASRRLALSHELGEVTRVFQDLLDDMLLLALEAEVSAADEVALVVFVMSDQITWTGEETIALAHDVLANGSIENQATAFAYDILKGLMVLERVSKVDTQEMV